MDKLYQYYRTVESRVDYLGKRYFKVDSHGDTVIQVCITAGEARRGRTNTFGVYVISRMTFVSNYLSMSYVEVVSKKEYEKHRDKVLNQLL